ncbi:hypothetical protein CDAR_239751 [Caerostris darwini]|uniref:Uncharacterized protein n=1 Tax=Caerostris darwini TaxID=1538125 RepID=A0AAV4R1D3_9ARAC|nr:hypothetical protein CDAR_239751 [Caerostris darwini]
MCKHQKQQRQLSISADLSFLKGKGALSRNRFSRTGGSRQGRGVSECDSGPCWGFFSMQPTCPSKKGKPGTAEGQTRDLPKKSLCTQESIDIGG